jgi:hypothetical protein
MGEINRESSGVSRALSAYWSESSRPLVSLAFVAPMLIAYEGGLWAVGAAATRNGADMWLRQWLKAIGFSQYYLLPLLTCGVLLVWHHLRRERWRVGGVVLVGMVFESLFVGALLLLVAHFQSVAFAASDRPFFAAGVDRATMGRVLPFLGAGIYEEFDRGERDVRGGSLSIGSSTWRWSLGDASG